MELDSDHDYAKLYRSRVANSQDLVTLISDSSNNRGSGKTVLSLILAEYLDRTDEGITTDKVAIDPDELTDAYLDQPRGSALVLDEAEAGLSKYRAGSAVNMAMRELVSMGRIEEKYLVLNLPASSELDRDLKALATAWVMVQSKGQAQCHALAWNPYQEEPRTPKLGRMSWDDIDEGHRLRKVYNYLTEEKMAHLRGDRDQSSQRVTASDAKEMVANAKQEARSNTRNELLTTVYQDTELTQKQLAESVGLSRSRLADIVNQNNN